MQHPNRGILIGIAGGSASGKTSVARKITEGIGSTSVAIVAQDSYYLDLTHVPEDAHQRHNFDHPDAFDQELLLQHMRILMSGGVVDLPIYDYTHHCRTGEFRRVGPHSVIVLEGILILYDRELRDLMDIKVYVETADDVRLMRRLRRDILERGRSVEMVLDQYETTVRPMHLQFIEPAKRFADIIVPTGAENLVAIDLLRTKIRQLLIERDA